MGVAHAHHCFVDIQTLLVKTTIAIAIHHVVVGLLGIEVLGTRLVGGERTDTVGKTFLDEVVAKVHIVFCTNGEGNIYRTSPIAVCNHLEHHEVALIESTLASKRDNHLVRDRVACHHHTALLDSILIDGDIYGIGRDDMHIALATTYPILDDVLELEWFVAEILFCFLWVCLVVFKNLRLQRRINLNIFVGA